MKKGNILIITQKIDSNDGVLGFFHGWVQEFSRNFEKVSVICLQKGDFSFSSNTFVYSMGKEDGVSKLKYLFLFYRYIWRLRSEYEYVFVHMNQEYVLLAGVFWRLWGKRVFMWRNHKKGSLLTRIASTLSHEVFYTSPQSFTAQFKNAHRMPVGIDTDFFQPIIGVQRKKNSILFLGRIAPVKNVIEFVNAMSALKEMRDDFTVTIAGAALPADAYYQKKFIDIISNLGLGKNIELIGEVTQEQAVRLYVEHEIYVNLTPSGSMDKTIFEAMACGSIPIVYNHDLMLVLGEGLVLQNLDKKHIADKVNSVFRQDTRNDFREYVVKEQSLSKLMNDFINQI